jgi:hypothetical protein
MPNDVKKTNPLPFRVDLGRVINSQSVDGKKNLYDLENSP